MKQVFEGSIRQSSNPLTKEQEVELLSQIKEEFKTADDYLRERKQEWQRRLKLYNNQRKNKDAVGDPLLYTVFNSVLSSIYDDQLVVEFAGKEFGDDVVAENTTAMAEYDYNLIRKNIIDYYWNWNTLFYGRGYVLFNGFDRKQMTPIVSVIDNLVAYHDPYAGSIHGFADGAAARYFGYEVQMTRAQMEKHGAYINLNKLEDEAKDRTSNQEQSYQARREASGTSDFTESEEYHNRNYQLLNWFTHYQNEKVLVTTNIKKSVVVRYSKQNCDYFPIVDRACSPTPFEWYGVSVPDLLEDKQRKKAVLSNIAVKSIELGLYPQTMYNKNVVNRSDLDYGINKMIGVDGIPANNIAQLPKDNPNLAFYNMIIQDLDSAAQRASATPELQQGTLSKQKRTLGELNLVASKSDTRYSLTAKIFGWSELDFWNMWYLLYKKYYKNFDKKIIRLTGAFGDEWRPLSRENIIAKQDPDIIVESKVLRQQRQQADLERYMLFYEALLQDPTSNRRYALKRLARLTGHRRDEIDRLLPLTTDEMIAEDQNIMLNQNKTVPVEKTDNHVVHLEIHQKANLTNATVAHIRAHKEALRLAKVRPELFSEEQGQMGLEPNETTGSVEDMIMNSTEPSMVPPLTPQEDGRTNIITPQMLQQ